MNKEEREKAFQSVYMALCLMPACHAAIRAIAGIRLLMIEDLGLERQRELIGLWNENCTRSSRWSG